MKKILLTIIFLFTLIIGIFVLWMNITPGHFHFACGRVLYVTNKEYEGAWSACPLFDPIIPYPFRFTEKLLLISTRLDLNKK